MGGFTGMNDLALVRDRFEITKLINSYGHFADNGQTDAFAALFADDARIDVGVPGVASARRTERFIWS
jgi:hypothetical protein